MDQAPFVHDDLKFHAKKVNTKVISLSLLPSTGTKTPEKSFRRRRDQNKTTTFGNCNEQHVQPFGWLIPSSRNATYLSAHRNFSLELQNSTSMVLLAIQHIPFMSRRWSHEGLVELYPMRVWRASHQGGVVSSEFISPQTMTMTVLPFMPLV